MKDKCIGYLLIGIPIIIGLIAFDLVLIPWVLKRVLSWFGVVLSLGQCIVIVLLFNLLTYGFRKRD